MHKMNACMKNSWRLTEIATILAKRMAKDFGENELSLMRVFVFLLLSGMLLLFLLYGLHA